ncbi:hypothetical protein DUNSADRAFT_4895 [Dunaliella salina]|uniref:Sugar phosphate transporter domain-containing protein n=1 Tax=Dunaliella salina TaxID=3046 RepID=A0ABQ7GR55_DUNSA|nr:hypothetical protein DUNSADRAFT_4895 [Dunaliella salina]|eukprot:KAF5837062.1 hypothetical protein DUNSADRAFT_4895 [Dunaliella salina]
MPYPLCSLFAHIAGHDITLIIISCIVFANKWVFSYYHFKFVFALTWVHTIFTCVGMNVLAAFGFFQPKSIPAVKLIPLAMGFVGYIVLCNVSLNINSVGFYQIMKVAISPVLVVMEFFMFGKLPSKMMLASVLVVCAGVTVATVTDKVVINNMLGLAIWVGSKQRELQANSSQLLQAYTPHAIWLLAILIPIFEPVGILVSLSTFLVIGATSSLTYNIVGHLKTVIILTGGVVFFGDNMSRDRLIGIAIAMSGIAWYTKLLTSPQQQSTPPVVKSLNGVSSGNGASGKP